MICLDQIFGNRVSNLLSSVAYIYLQHCKKNFFWAQRILKRMFPLKSENPIFYDYITFSTIVLCVKVKVDKFIKLDLQYLLLKSLTWPNNINILIIWIELLKLLCEISNWKKLVNTPASHLARMSFTLMNILTFVSQIPN